MSDENSDVFGQAIGSGMKTYITAGVGVVLSFLSGFNLINLTDKQTVSLTGGVIFLAFIFTRLAIFKNHKTSLVALSEATAAKDASQAAAGAANKTAGIVSQAEEAKADPFPPQYASAPRRRKKI